MRWPIVPITLPWAAKIPAPLASMSRHKRYPTDMITFAIKTGVIEGHDEMPALRFSPSELKDLLASIDSLSPPGTPHYTR